MRASLTLDGTTVPLDEYPMYWRGSVVIDHYKYAIVVDLAPVGPVIDPAGDGYDED